MKAWNDLPFDEKIRWRIRLLRVTAAAMLVYMIVVGELGGDSRKLTPFARDLSNLMFFGGLGYVLFRISANKKLLINRYQLKQKMLEEQDERNRYLHDKSGGTVMDILLLILWFTTMTTAMFDMTAFYTAVSILAAAASLKAGAYWVYNRHV